MPLKTLEELVSEAKANVGHISQRSQIIPRRTRLR